MRLLLLIGVVALAGCDNPFGGDPSLSGRWAGGSSTSDLTLDLTLAESEDGEVQGSGVMTYTAWFFGDEVTVSPSVRAAGMHEYPYVSVTLELSSGGVRELTGELQGESRWTGQLCSSGGGCEPVELGRR